MNTNEFRAEVAKIMPGYKWTVARPYRLYGESDTAPGFALMTATGIQTVGFNRMSTMEIVRRDENGAVHYEVSVADYGTRGPWVQTGKGPTIARALRYVQDRCEAMRGVYAACVGAMEKGRLPILKNPKIPVDNSESAGV